MCRHRQRCCRCWWPSRFIFRSTATLLDSLTSALHLSSLLWSARLDRSPVTVTDRLHAQPPKKRCFQSWPELQSVQASCEVASTRQREFSRGVFVLFWSVLLLLLLLLLLLCLCEREPTTSRLISSRVDRNHTFCGMNLKTFQSLLAVLFSKKSSSSLSSSV